MHFGLFSLMTQRDCSVSPQQLYHEVVEQVRMAEQMFGKDMMPRIDRAVGGLARVGHAA